jgi:hypothetical protein
VTNITRPTGLALRDWADQIVLDLNAFGTFGRLDDVTQWQDWAVQFLNNTTLGRNIARPYDFADWLEWAERFCLTFA